MFATSNLGGWLGDYLIHKHKVPTATARKVVNTIGKLPNVPADRGFCCEADRNNVHGSLTYSSECMRWHGVALHAIPWSVDCSNQAQATSVIHMQKLQQASERAVFNTYMVSACLALASVCGFSIRKCLGVVLSVPFCQKQHWERCQALTCRLSRGSHRAHVYAKSTHCYRRGDSHDLCLGPCWLCKRRFLCKPHGHSSQVRWHSDGHLQHSWYLGR